MYWETWHQLRYATPLPLSLVAPQAVKSTIVDDFVADHRPTARAAESACVCSTRWIKGFARPDTTATPIA